MRSCQLDRSGRRLSTCRGPRPGNHCPPQSAAPSLQRLQYRRGRHGHDRRPGALGRRESPGLSCADQLRRRRGRRARPCAARRYVGRLRHLTDHRRDRLEAAEHARGAARLHGLDQSGAHLNNSEYPRDLIGYAANPPQVRWPNDARVAVSFVLNYEEGGEYCVLHGDAHSEYVLTDVGGDPLPDARNLNIESIFEYGSRVGFWELMRLLRERRVDATIYAVGMALERNPVAAAEMARSGLEVICHGQRWIDYQFVPEEIERADIQ